MSNGNGAKTPDKIPPPPQAYYDFNKSVGPPVAVTMPVGPSLTRQEFAEECDINVLMQRFENRDIGAIMRAAQEPVYADFAAMPNNLMDAMQMMRDAETAFMTLPAQVRREFDNDAIAFVDYASDPANLEQMRTWGLAPPGPKPEAPSPVVPANGGGSAEPPPLPGVPQVPPGAQSST